MTEKDPLLERLTNLTFALLNAERLGRRFLTANWIRKNVAGYEGLSDAAFDKAFSRDRGLLAKVGVPLETVAAAPSFDGSISPGYRLSQEEYPLPEVRFTPEEATVLGLAGDLGLRKELAAFARSGWTKIAAAGATRNAASAAEFSAIGDIRTITAEALDIILKAGSTGGRITFEYISGPDAPAVQRIMDPWGLVTLRGRLYLVGHDVDKDAPRSFRISRLNNIAAQGKGAHPIPQGINLQEVVEESLRRGHQLIDATLRIAPGKASELSEIGEKIPEDTYVLKAVDRAWLIRTATAYAPHAIVIEPEEVRQEIRENLNAIATATQLQGRES